MKYPSPDTGARYGDGYGLIRVAYSPFHRGWTSFRFFGRDFFGGYRSERVKAWKALPIRETPAEAQTDLDKYAAQKGWKRLETDQ